MSADRVERVAKVLCAWQEAPYWVREGLIPSGLDEHDTFERALAIADRGTRWMDWTDRAAYLIAVSDKT